MKMQYDYTGKHVSVKDNADYNVYEYNNDSSPLIKRYKALLACEWDVNYAIACLDQMFFKENTSLIDGCLINTSILILVKLFTNPCNQGRVHLDEVKVLRSFSEKNGKKDYTKLFRKFYDARNEVIAHDQNDYKKNILGVTVEKTTQKAVELCPIAIKTRYLYEENQQILKEMFEVIKLYISEQLMELEAKILEEYNENIPLNKCPLQVPCSMNVW